MSPFSGDLLGDSRMSNVLDKSFIQRSYPKLAYGSIHPTPRLWRVFLTGKIFRPMQSYKQDFIILFGPVLLGQTDVDEDWPSSSWVC